MSTFHLDFPLEHSQYARSLHSSLLVKQAVHSLSIHCCLCFYLYIHIVSPKDKMKFVTATFLALAASSFAAPIEDTVEKRAVCTAGSFTYSCAGSTTTTTSRATTSTRAATTTTATIATTTATTNAATSTAGGASPTGTTGYSSGSTAGDVDNGVCAQLTVIFARGTGETGTVGTVAGPPMFKQLSSDLSKKVALQGVSYPASSSVSDGISERYGRCSVR